MTAHLLKEQKWQVFVLLTVNLCFKRTKSALFVLLNDI